MPNWWENFLDWWNSLPNNEAMFYVAILSFTTTLLGGLFIWFFKKKKESDRNPRTTNNNRAAMLHKSTLIQIDQSSSIILIIIGVFFFVVAVTLIAILLFNEKTKEFIETPIAETTKPIETPTEKITKTEAFEILFGSGWQVSPYSDNEEYPCYKYQGKWELYEKNDYFLPVKRDPFIYYKPISVVAYMWCQPDVDGANAKESMENGYMLKGIELLKNSVHKSNTEIDSITDLNDENLIGIMSGLLIDVITFDLQSKEPTKRDSERIGRHRYISIRESDDTNNITNFIAEFKPTDCSIEEKGSKESYKGKDGVTQQQRLLENYRIKFKCKHKGTRNGYYTKQLTFKEKWIP